MRSRCPNFAWYKSNWWTPSSLWPNITNNLMPCYTTHTSPHSFSNISTPFVENVKTADTDVKYVKLVWHNTALNNMSKPPKTSKAWSVSQKENTHQLFWWLIHCENYLSEKMSGYCRFQTLKYGDFFFALFYVKCLTSFAMTGKGI